jgi:hypothetical protein
LGKEKKKSKSCYDPDTDENIIKTIENSEEGKCSFNEVKKELGTTARTLTKHLNILEARNIIERDKIEIPWSRKKRYIRLTQNTKIKRKYYGSFKLDYRNVKGLCKDKKYQIDKDRQKYRRMKLVLFLLFALASGYTGYKNLSKEGGVVIKGGDYQEGNTTNYNATATTRTVSAIDPEPGFSPNDLERSDYQLSIIQTGMRLNRFEKDETDEIMSEIAKYKEVKLERFLHNGKIRYKIVDEALKEFLIYCCNIITTLIQVMRAYFFLFNKQGEPDERQWFYDIVGDETANAFFRQIEDNKAEKKIIRDLYIEFYQYDKRFPNDKDNRKFVNRVIQCCLKLDEDFFTKKKLENRLLSKFNHNSLVAQLIMDSVDINQKQEELEQLKDKYPFIFDELKNIVNPPFSHKWFKLLLSSTPPR